MMAAVVSVPMEEIHDWASFHDVFARVLGFPGFYGRNMNAWIDCLSSADAPEDGMMEVHAAPDGCLMLDLGDCTDFARRCPEQHEAILDCSGFVNWRRAQAGAGPVIALSFRNSEPVFGGK